MYISSESMFVDLAFVWQISYHPFQGKWYIPWLFIITNISTSEVM